MKITLKTPDCIPKPKGRQNFLTPWPTDLPTKCPDCLTPFDSRLNLAYKKSKLAQTLREIAWWAPLPTLPIAIYICFGIGLSGNGAMMSFAMMIILPAIILNLFYAILPTHRYLTCKTCPYHHTDQIPRYNKSIQLTTTPKKISKKTPLPNRHPTQIPFRLTAAEVSRRRQPHNPSLNTFVPCPSK